MDQMQKSAEKNYSSQAGGFEIGDEKCRYTIRARCSIADVLHGMKEPEPHEKEWTKEDMKTCPMRGSLDDTVIIEK